MKKLRANLEKWFDGLDERWQKLTLRKQQQYTLYFFVGYLLLTAGVICKVCLDTTRSDNDMLINHIEKPVLKKKESPEAIKDTLITILKKKIYEGK